MLTPVELEKFEMRLLTLLLLYTHAMVAYVTVLSRPTTVLLHCFLLGSSGQVRSVVMVLPLSYSTYNSLYELHTTLHL